VLGNSVFVLCQPTTNVLGTYLQKC